MSYPLRPYGLYSSPGSSVHGILQETILEWVVIKPGSPALQADSLPSDPLGSPINCDKQRTAPSPYHPSGSSQGTSPKRPVSCIEPGLVIGSSQFRRHRFNPGLGRSPGVGNDNPLQYSCQNNLMDRGAWQAIVHGITKS